MGVAVHQVDVAVRASSTNARIDCVHTPLLVAHTTAAASQGAAADVAAGVALPEAAVAAAGAAGAVCSHFILCDCNSHRAQGAAVVWARVAASARAGVAVA